MSEKQPRRNWSDRGYRDERLQKLRARQEAEQRPRDIAPKTPAATVVPPAQAPPTTSTATTTAKKPSTKKRRRQTRGQHARVATARSQILPASPAIRQQQTQAFTSPPKKGAGTTAKEPHRRRNMRRQSRLVAKRVASQRTTAIEEPPSAEEEEMEISEGSQEDERSGEERKKKTRRRETRKLHPRVAQIRAQTLAESPAALSAMSRQPPMRESTEEVTAPAAAQKKGEWEKRRRADGRRQRIAKERPKTLPKTPGNVFFDLEAEHGDAETLRKQVPEPGSILEIEDDGMELGDEEDEEESPDTLVGSKLQLLDTPSPPDSPSRDYSVRGSTASSMSMTPAFAPLTPAAAAFRASLGPMATPTGRIPMPFIGQTPRDKTLPDIAAAIAAAGSDEDESDRDAPMESEEEEEAEEDEELEEEESEGKTETPKKVATPAAAVAAAAESTPARRKSAFERAAMVPPTPISPSLMRLVGKFTRRRTSAMFANWQVGVGGKKKTKPSRARRVVPAHLRPSFLKAIARSVTDLTIKTDTVPALADGCQQLFAGLITAVEASAKSEGRGVIELSDVESVLWRNGHLNPNRSVNDLMRKELPLEVVESIFPIARAHNLVLPSCPTI